MTYAGPGEIGRRRREASHEVVATMLGRRPVAFAELTNTVSVATADPELRRADLRGPAVPDADVVAP